MSERPLLFVDSNIWLDFYRARSDAGKNLLKHLETIKGYIIVSHQVEMEFKKNRQDAIMEAINSLKEIPNHQRPAIFSNAKEVSVIGKNIKAANARIVKLRNKLSLLFSSPSQTDEVYKICQRIFHKEDELTLTRDDKKRRVILHKAHKRYLLGCPPKKNSDTSIGDAFNWEWIVDCASRKNKNVVIVSRDGDYGRIVNDKCYINDHLLEEFKERVNIQKKISLANSLSATLKQFQIKVTPSEEKEEEIMINTSKELESSPQNQITRASLIPGQSRDPFKAALVDFYMQMYKPKKNAGDVAGSDDKSDV